MAGALRATVSGHLRLRSSLRECGAFSIRAQRRAGTGQALPYPCSVRDHASTGVKLERAPLRSGRVQPQPHREVGTMDHGDNEQPDKETPKAPQPRALSLPSWLDGQTIAILTSMALLAAMNQAGVSRLRDDIHQLRHEMCAMRAELVQETGQGFGSVRGEMRGEIGGLRDDLRRLDERLRRVEIDVAAIRAYLLGSGVQPAHGEPQHQPP